MQNQATTDSPKVSSTSHDLIRLTFENSEGLELYISWYLFSVLLLLAILLWAFRRKLKSLFESVSTKGYKIKFSVPGIEFEKEIERSFQNVHISNRIYIELITRKAAIQVDESADVLVEIYDSWYSLFKTVREEIKNIPGEQLRNNKSTENLIEITTKILNEGLRPHLTKYQSKFRKWYEEALVDEINKGKTPQQIQQEFPEFNELVDDMKSVSIILMTYSSKLKEFVAGKS